MIKSRRVGDPHRHDQTAGVDPEDALPAEAALRLQQVRARVWGGVWFYKFD